MDTQPLPMSEGSDAAEPTQEPLVRSMLMRDEVFDIESDAVEFVSRTTIPPPILGPTPAAQAPDGEWDEERCSRPTLRLMRLPSDAPTVLDASPAVEHVGPADEPEARPVIERVVARRRRGPLAAALFAASLAAMFAAAQVLPSSPRSSAPALDEHAPFASPTPLRWETPPPPETPSHADTPLASASAVTSPTQAPTALIERETPAKLAAPVPVVSTPTTTTRSVDRVRLRHYR